MATNLEIIQELNDIDSELNKQQAEDFIFNENVHTATWAKSKLNKMQTTTLKIEASGRRAWIYKATCRKPVKELCRCHPARDPI